MALLMCACKADAATEITYAFAEYVRAEAGKAGVEHTCLGDADACPEKVKVELAKNPKGFFHFDHGSYNAIYGEMADGSNNLVALVDLNNASLLKGCLVDTLSCESARDLGVKAIQEGARAYLGYGEVTYIANDEETKVVMNTAKVALLNGKTAGEAYDAQLAAYGEPSQCGVSKTIRALFGSGVLRRLRVIRDAIVGRVPNILRQNFYDWNKAHYVLLGSRDEKL